MCQRFTVKCWQTFQLVRKHDPGHSSVVRGQQSTGMEGKGMSREQLTEVGEDQLWPVPGEVCSG